MLINPDHIGRRVYDADPDSSGPAPGGVYRELHGGPLDGFLLDVGGWTEAQMADGACRMVPADPGGIRADCSPRLDDLQRWDYHGPIPC